MFEVVVLNVALELKSIEFDALVRLVTPEKRERINRFHFKHDAQNCLLGDVLARIELCNATGLINRQLEFSVNEYGKPFLLNHPRVHYNISHSGHYVVCAIADEAVGIDIEMIKPPDMKIAERFFARDEIEYIICGEQMQRFYEVWTKKESHIKREGKGLSMPLPSFNIFDQSLQVTFHQVFQNDEAVCHVCSGKKEKPSVRVIDTAALMRMFS